MSFRKIRLLMSKYGFSILFIGDDGYRYQLEGQQLTLKEADQDLGNQDTIVLTKQ